MSALPVARLAGAPADPVLVPPPAPVPPVAPASESAPQGTYLPTPPSEGEKYGYLGPRRRWPVLWLLLARVYLAVVAGWALASAVTAAGAGASGSRTLVELGVGLGIALPLALYAFRQTRGRVGKRRLTLEGHITFVEDWRRGYGRTAPSVDVVITLQGEEAAVLDNTLGHVSALDWPGALHVYVVGEPADQVARGLAERWGFAYTHVAAEAAQNAAAQAPGDGEIVIALDGDCAPRPDLLWETIPYLATGRAQVVQTAHYIDADCRVNPLARYAGSLQELRFRWACRCRDLIGHVSANMGWVRDAAGKRSQGPLRGRATLYLPLVLVRSLGPESWATLTQQRFRQLRRSDIHTRSRIGSLLLLIPILVALLWWVPVAALLWFTPGDLDAWRYLLVAPVVVSLAYVLSVATHGWHPSVLRVVTVEALTQLVGYFSRRRSVDRIPKRVAIAAWLWFAVSQSALGLGVVRYLRQGHDVGVTWPVFALLAWQFAVLLPILVRKPVVALDGRYVLPTKPVGVLAGLIAVSLAALVFSQTRPVLDAAASAEPAPAKSEAARSEGATGLDGNLGEVLGIGSDAGVMSGLIPLPRSGPYPDSVPSDCLLTRTQIVQPECAFGDLDGTRTMVLFGDGTVTQSFRAIDGYAKAHGYRLLVRAKTACPVADSVPFDADLGRTYQECLVWRLSQLAAIDALAPDVVLASQSDTLPGATASDAYWAAQTSATVGRLRSAAGQVVFLTDGPSTLRGAAVERALDVARVARVTTSEWPLSLRGKLLTAELAELLGDLP